MAKNYYVVLEGNIEKPIIVDSWGATQPLVTGVRSNFRGFSTREEAERYLQDHQVIEPNRVSISRIGRTASPDAEEKAYALANGYHFDNKPNESYVSPIISVDEKLKSRGRVGGPKSNAEKASGAWYRRSKIEAELEEYSEYWKQAVCDAYGRAIKDKLDEGYRPRDYKFKTDGFLYKPRVKVEGDSYVDDMLNDLDLGD